MSTTTTTTKEEPFPIKTRVILSGLKAEEFNDQPGIIQGGLQNGRQLVHVPSLDKTAAIKLSNIHYEPRPLESLSNKELKSILRHRLNMKKFQGLDKTDLQNALKELTEDPLEIAKSLATATAGGGTSSDTNTANNANNSVEAQLNQLDSMSPEQLRQQAQMMKSVPPNQIRKMNPHLAHMSDAQILQAATQMEMMASNPQMMQMAKDQMRNMTPQQKAQYNQMMSGGGGGAANAMPTMPTTGGSTNPQDMLANMTPEQLKQQAEMMKSMTPATLRQMNPQLANMTDEQIQAATRQMEMMANNPELLKMANDQMKSMTPEQREAMMKEARQGGGGAGNMMNPNMMNMMGGGGTAAGAGGQAPPTLDPTKMLETMDAKQIKDMMTMLQSNPEMLQQLAAQTGMPKEGLEKTLNMFAGMSDDQLEASLKTMARFQKVTGTFQNAWKSVDSKVGGYLKPIFIITIILLFVSLLLYFLGGSDDATAATVQQATKTLLENTKESAPKAASGVEDELSNEFDEF